MSDSDVSKRRKVLASMSDEEAVAKGQVLAERLVSMGFCCATMLVHEIGVTATFALVASKPNIFADIATGKITPENFRDIIPAALRKPTMDLDQVLSTIEAAIRLMDTRRPPKPNGQDLS
jgi:hypothetical protein